ncbi:MAG: DUF421 domain-containing protein [Acutalibacteraceae bacterium]|nr:DUF421 domain-containing protein [Acutalibacteraceae bacterium]
MTISVIRTLILYILVLVMVRVMGKRQISELQTSELVVTLLISNIAVIPMQDTSLPLLSGAVPILLLVACEIILSFGMLKNAKFRRIICGKPQIIISNGIIDQKKMKLLRISTEDLSEQLRQAGAFALEDVKYAIVETNGKLSVMKKPQKDTVTAEQMNISNPKNTFEVVVISDGEIAKNSMKFAGVTDDWLDKTLKKAEIDVKDVFIMTATPDHKYNIIKKER